MKCHCPACGRSTEIDPSTLGFFARCLRCGALLKAQLQEEEGPGAIAARVIHPGRVREGQSSNGTIANLLSRMPTPRTPAPALPVGEPLLVPETVPPQEDKDKDLYALAPVAAAKPVTTIADLQIQVEKLPPKYQRRVALREKQQMLGMVTVFGIGMSALIAVGAVALKSRDLFIRSAHAHTRDTVQPAPAPPASAPAEAPDAESAQSTDNQADNQGPQFTVGDKLSANPAANP